MAVVPGLNIGVGLLLLIVVWAAALLVSLALAAVPKARYAVPVVLGVAVVLTLILLFYPREADSQTASTQAQDVDSIFFGRLVLLLFLSVFLVGGGAAVVVTHFSRPVTAGPLRPRPLYVTS